MPLELDTGFYDLEWLSVRWGLPENHILGMALEDFLELSIHVDGLLLFRGRIIQHDHSYEKTGIVSHHYGTLPLRAHDTEEIILRGSVETRCFRPRPGDDFCELEGGQPSRRIEIKDLVVAWETADKYERSRKIKVRNLEDEKPSLINPQTQYDLIVEDGYKVVFLGLTTGTWGRCRQPLYGSCMRLPSQTSPGLPASSFLPVAVPNPLISRIFSKEIRDGRI